LWSWPHRGQAGWRRCGGWPELLVCVFFDCCCIFLCYITMFHFRHIFVCLCLFYFFNLNFIQVFFFSCVFLCFVLFIIYVLFYFIYFLFCIVFIIVFRACEYFEYKMMWSKEKNQKEQNGIMLIFAVIHRTRPQWPHTQNNNNSIITNGFGLLFFLHLKQNKL